MNLLQQLETLSRSKVYPFHMPGHKRRLAKNQLLKNIYKIDITEIDGFDNLHEAEGILKEAQEKAAKVFGAYETLFLVNGATSGIVSAIYALSSEGEKAIIARNCHKSVYNGIMLSGAKPIYIYPEQEAYFEINSGISANRLKELFEKEGQGSKIVVITSPTYEGVVSDIESIATVCHENNAYLIVDSAHGAHLGFSEDFPKSAISKGADIVITSIHKTLPAPTQTALIHISNNCKDANKIKKMLKVFMTSSPSYILMSGIVDCIDLLDENADILFKEYSERLDELYEEAKSYNNLSILTKDKLTVDASYDFDKGKIIISDKSQKLSGKEIYDILLNTYELQPEMALGSYCLLMTSIADDKAGFNRLREALKQIDKYIEDDSVQLKRRNIVGRIFDRFVGKRVKKILFNTSIDVGEDLYTSDIAIESITRCNIKEASLNNNTEWIPIELSEGRVSADYVVPYPPCIPLVVPGEELTGQIVDKILECINQGLNVNGIRNKEIEVIWEKSSI